MPSFDVLAARAARPLCWWTPAQLDAMAARLHAPWAQWLADWVPGGGAAFARVQCRLAWDAPQRLPAAWHGIGARAAGQAWLAGAADGAPPCFGLLFGGGERGASATQPHPMGDGIARQAQQHLCELLRQALALDDAPAQAEPCAGLPKAWSGAVAVTLGPEHGRHIRLLLNHGAAAHLLGGQAGATRPPAADPGAPPLVPVQSALAGRTLTANVELAGCELDFGTLAGLRIGDVVSLAHPLDAPVRVSVAGVPLCAGFLGRRGAARAIELVRDAAPADNLQTSQP